MTDCPDGNDFEIVNGTLVKYRGHDAVVYVPKGVVHIGEAAFTEPVAIAGVQGEPPPMLSWGGMDNPILEKESYMEPGGFDFLREVYLPQSVETIGRQAFQMSMNLERIHLPAGLKEIGEKAFARCYSLKQVEVPANTVIGWNAFFMTRTKVVRLPKK